MCSSAETEYRTDCVLVGGMSTTAAAAAAVDRADTIGGGHLAEAQSVPELCIDDAKDVNDTGEDNDNVHHCCTDNDDDGKNNDNIDDNNNDSGSSKVSGH